jgi:hypothetical protein
MLFAFSRDRAVPGHQLWSAVNAKRVPANAVIVTAVIAALITLPALVKVDINGAPVPVAFFAVVSIGVVGLYLAFAVPIYYRWKAGDSFKVGSWNLRGHHRWMAPLALIEIIVTSIIAMFPTSLGGAPGPQLRVEVRELHPAAGGCHAHPALHLLARLGEEVVHRADPPGRRHR